MAFYSWIKYRESWFWKNKYICLSLKMPTKKKEHTTITYLTSDERLDELYWEGVAKKLNRIGQVQFEVRVLLDDYLWNEWLALELNSQNMPQNRKVEFAKVCRVLQNKTVEDICNILRGHEHKVHTVGTLGNREFLLKRFHLWSGA